MEYVTLNNNIKMPNNGIGVFMLSPDEAYTSVLSALKSGVRLIDTANAYENEKKVGEAIKDSGVNRSEIFLSTKLWPSEYEKEDAVERTLKRLGVDYIDLLFLHQPSGNYIKGYETLVKAYKDGKIKAIGISNFEGKYLEEILSKFDIKPQVMQVECHPYFTQEETRKELDKYNIKIMSWYPLGHGDKNLINEEIFKELGNKYHKSPAQIILRWHTQMGFIVIPGSKNPEHIKDNFNIYDFKLTNEELQKISVLNKNKRYYIRTDEALKSYASWSPNLDNQ